jgi:hypothetical protein
VLDGSELNIIRNTMNKPKPASPSVPAKPIDSLILTIRGQKVLLDADLAELYGVPTKRLNEAVKRNAERFPPDFRFQLTQEEAESANCSRSQNATLKRGQNIKYLPHVFTEHGAIMAATVLNSPEAVSMSVFVVRAFVQMREHILANTDVLKRLAEIDKTFLKHDRSLQIIWQEIQPLLTPPPAAPTRKIGFHT